jgi:hypothetical protein
VGARTDTSGHPVESVEPLLLHKRLDGFEGSLVLANRRALLIIHPTVWTMLFCEARSRLETVASC